MSEQINKVLASTAQSFTTAQQAQARANIGAMPAASASAFEPKITYAYNADNAISSLNGSAIGSTFDGLYRDTNLSGSGTSAVPLGLNSAISIDVPLGFGYVSGNIYLGPQPTWYGVNMQSPKITITANSSSGLQISHSGLQISTTAESIGGNKVYTEYDYAGVRILNGMGGYWLYNAHYEGTGVGLEYYGSTAHKSNLTYNGLQVSDTTEHCHVNVSASAIGVSANGHEIVLDYNFFTSLSAWATANGWTP